MTPQSTGRAGNAGPALVILAAGMGSRFGGMKQLATLGPHGETLMDYSIHDAARAGFESVVFIIRPEMEGAFRELIQARYAGAVPCFTAHQRLDAVPAGTAVPPDRAKPWGTGQAVLAARDVVRGAFAVVNADDFYGRAAYDALARFLSARRGAGLPVFGLVGYPIRETLSPSGGVNRGVIQVAPDGTLESIEEVIDIRDANGTLAGTVHGHPRPVRGDALVSMNMWGFTPEVFDLLDEGFRGFLAAGPGARGEYLLPTAIQDAVSNGHARVRVLPAGGTWFGVTYPDDAPAVASALRELVGSGVYPAPLRSSGNASA